MNLSYAARPVPRCPLCLAPDNRWGGAVPTRAQVDHPPDRSLSWLSGRGFDHLTGVFAIGTGVATPFCALNPRHVPRTPVQTGGEEHDVGVVNDAAPSKAPADQLKPPRPS